MRNGKSKSFLKEFRDKRFKIIIPLIFFCLLINGSLKVYCQIPGVTRVGDNIYGEIVNSTNGGFISTPNTLYGPDNTPEYGWGEYGRSIWKVPQGLKIVKLGHKPKDRSKCLILLSNGDIYELVYDINNAEIISTFLISHVNDVGSFDWDKIEGDALYALSSSHFFVSRDNGGTWIRDTTGSNGAHINDFMLDTLQYVYSATDKGFFKQHPDSNIWHKITSSTFGNDNNFAKVFIDRKNRIFISSNNGGKIYKSIDSGNSWSLFYNGVDNGFQSFSTFGDDSQGNVYAVTSSSSATPNAIYKSIGGISNWVRIDQNLQSLTVNTPTINSIGGNQSIYIGSTFGMFTSTDQGQTWIDANRKISAETISGFIKARNGKLVTSTALAIFTGDANNSTQWIKRFPENGYKANLPLYQDGLGNLYTIEPRSKGIGNVLKSSDNGNTWVYDTLGVGTTSFGLFCVDENGIQHSVTTGYSNNSPLVIYKKNIGGNWVTDTDGMKSVGLSFGKSMASDQHGMLYLSGYLYAANTSTVQRVFRRAINGSTWSVDNLGLDAITDFTYFSYMAPDKNGMMYGLYDGNLLRRTNNGWASVPKPQGQLLFANITTIAFASDNALLASFSSASLQTGKPIGNGIYKSTDFGSNWSLVGLDSLTINKISVSGDSVYVSTNRGLYLISNNVVSVPSSPTAINATNIGQNSFSANWNSISGASGYYLDVSTNNTFSSFVPGYNNKDVSNVNSYSVNGLSAGTQYFYRVRAYNSSGTSGNSNIISVLLVDVSENGELPIVYWLGQNYPNPFNPSTKIKYDIPVESKVVIKVYDLLGKEVITLVNDEQPAGRYQVNFNANYLPSGMYICKISAGNYFKTRKMLLIK